VLTSKERRDAAPHVPNMEGRGIPFVKSARNCMKVMIIGAENAKPRRPEANPMKSKQLDHLFDRQG
jgi:predicted membrane GTPase involved in stress response